MSETVDIDAGEREHRLVDEHAALRRLATLVAHGASRQDLFEAVVAEVGRIFDWPWVGLMRYEPGRPGREE